VGSVSVDVVPDARGWAEKLRAQIRDQTVEVKANADTEEANLELDKTARTRTAKIKADVSQLSQGASMLDKWIGGLGMLPALALTAGAALVPLAAAIGGVTAAIGAPLLIAGGGVGLFAVMGGLAVAQAEKQLKALQVLQTHLGTLTKGTAAYATAAKAVAVAHAALPPGVRGFATALEGLKSTFAHVDMPILLKPITAALVLLQQVLPLVNPLLKATSGAFTTLIGQLSQGVKSGGFADFIRQISKQVGPDILAFAHIAGNGIAGLTGLLLGLDRAFGGGILHGLERLSGGFANLGANAKHSQWLKDFVDYFHKVGPQVGDTIAAVARALGHMVAALAPLGPRILWVIRGLANAFSSIPIPVLTKIAEAAAGLVLFQKLGGFKVAGLVGKIAGGQSVVGAIAGGGVQKVFVVNMGAGGLGGPGGPSGGPGGIPGFLEKHPFVAGGVGVTGVGAIAAALVAATVLYFRAASTPGPVPVGGHDPAWWAKFNASRLHQQGMGPGGSTGVIAKDFNLANIGNLTKFGTHLDALHQQAGAASRAIDLIGPHAEQASGVAIRALRRLEAELASIHDRKFQVIAETASAIHSLEALQAYRLRDKSFNVYQHNLGIERGVGPGGGMGNTPPGSAPRTGTGHGGSGSVPVHIHLGPDGMATLHGIMDSNYQANATADQRYADSRAMR